MPDLTINTGAGLGHTANELTKQDGAVAYDIADPGTTAYDFFNDGQTFLFIENTSTTVASTVTFYIRQQVAGISVTNPTVAFATGALRYFGPFDARIYNDSDGKCRVSVATANTGLDMWCLRIGS